MKRIILSVLTMSALLCGCQKDHVSELAQERGTIQATIEEISATRTVMDEDNNIRWSEGDQIVGFMRSTLGVKYQVTTASVGKTSASFEEVSSGGLNAGTELEHIIAYYPYSSSVSAAKSGSNYTLDVILPTEQTYVAESFGNGAMPMVAVSETNNITFRNVCGGMKLQLKGTQKVTSIKVEGKNGELLSGAATVTTYTDETKPAITMASGASTSVTLNCGEGVQLNENAPTEFIIALPPVKFTKGFTVTITHIDGNTQTVETSKENEVLRSSLLIMPVATLKITELSESGTANCYMISEAGFYKFVPTKGNSYDSIGDIASTEVLWESFGSNITPSVGDLVRNVSYENGFISFETPTAFKEGNALIVAKDMNGTILWSWHIWLTDQPEEQMYYNNAGVMMDRNLGATSAQPGDYGALGLLYQWGRKDPFLGSSNINDNVIAESTYSWPSAVDRQSSIEYTIKHPTTYIYSDKSYNADWYYVSKNVVDTTRWSSTKTIYDPCPIGWRVPDGGKNSVWRKGYNKPESLVNKFDSINKGIDFSGLLGSSDTIWYPATGYRTYNTGELYGVGNQAFYWSGNLKYAYGWGVWSLEISDYYSPGFTLQDYDAYCAGGGPIRCLKEGSPFETD